MFHCEQCRISKLLCVSNFLFIKKNMNVFRTNHLDFIFTDGCICLHGYHGDNCSASCDLGWYGYQCNQQCQCENNATCDPVSGSCICPPGFTGKLCQYSKLCQVFCHLLHLLHYTSIILYEFIKKVNKSFFVVKVYKNKKSLLLNPLL